MVGLASAKALAFALNKPLYGVNHLVGHVAVDLLEHGPLPDRCVALLVSGGHVSTQVERIADSIGAGARRLTTPQARRTTRSRGCSACRIPEAPTSTGLRPGIPVMSGSHAASAPKDRERHRFDFSFSGLKTAVARWVEARAA